MINISNLSKFYHGKQVLDDIHLTIAKGEIHAILGKSGVGKSTLLKCMNGLESYDQGSIVIDRKPIETLRGHELQQLRKSIGMIFQDFALLERKTVSQNIKLPMQFWKYTKDEIHAKLNELITFIELKDKLDMYPKSLSGGQKQRVAIARTLSLDPTILLCDEVTSALDPITTQSILSLLKSLNETLGITIVLVTHQIEVVKKIAHRMTILEEGKVVLTDDIGTIFTHFPEALQRLLIPHNISCSPDQYGYQIKIKHAESQRYFFSELSKTTGINIQLLSSNTEIIGEDTLTTLYIGISPKDDHILLAFLDASSVIYQRFS